MTFYTTTPDYRNYFLLISVFILSGLWSCNSNSSSLNEELFQKHVRTTEARTPEEEKAGFHLPPGFEAQLFASEPDIGKPLNMAFDAKGRMWLTQSYDYPFADTTGASKDRISILEDTDGDGKADKFSVFADSLNIPIGIVAVPDGAIAYSIPHIYHFIDRDGDNRVDERKILYSGFEYKDTHGMINNLIRSWDGWIHAGHGFSNTSRVAGSDGDTIVMYSGNTFRFREDGSRVEFTTTGRVNPFGYAYDEWGYTYSVDCHTSPIYQIIRGADYPHFGKKPTGIGFGPALMEHDHGATALAGLEFYLATHFPKEYQQSFYLGDVVKSRVYRSTMTMKGTTPAISWEDDFIISDDPWFRPVDVKMGPDGALYIADFYNRIIGHYEVPLDHPGRDRQRGRIWRIVYTGEKEKPATTPAADLSTQSLQSLTSNLDNPNLPLRMAVADQIVDRFGEEAIPAIFKIAQGKDTQTKTRIQAMWILYRLNALPEDLLADIATSTNDTLRVHALRIMYEYAELSDILLEIAAESLEHPSPHVQRQAAMVISQHPRIGHLAGLLQLRHSVSEEDDSHFFYSVRQSIRDHLRDDKVMDYVSGQSWSEADAIALANLMVGVDNIEAAEFLLDYLSRYQEVEEHLLNYSKHIARFIPVSGIDKLIEMAKSESDSKPELAYHLFNAIDEGLTQGGKTMSAVGQTWGLTLARTFLDEKMLVSQWQIFPNEHLPYSEMPWRVVDTLLDGEKISMLASGPVDGGGREVSTAISDAFSIPPRLEFHLIGRKNQARENELPTKPVNRIELRLAGNDSLIAETFIEEQETRTKVIWDLSAHTDQQGYLVIADGSGAYGEYIAAGGFQPAVASVPEQSPRSIAQKQIFAANTVARYGGKDFVQPLEKVLSSSHADVHARVAAAEALIHLNGEELLPLVTGIMQNPGEPLLLREKLAFIISRISSDKALTAVENSLIDFSYRSQLGIAREMIRTSKGIDFLLRAAEEVRISPRILLDPQIKEQIADTATPDQKSRLESITSRLKAPSETIDALIDARRKGFRDAAPALEAGKIVFSQYCTPCHQIAGQGGNIGPQLDGIGNWGEQALTEKILDPNRNISKAFINYTLKLKDGKTVTGLFRREEGETQVYADVSGKEFSISKSEIVQREVSPYTLMPDHFGQSIPEADFYALLHYLLQEK